MSEIIVACFEHCRYCCPLHDGQAAEEECKHRNHIWRREFGKETANYYAGAATPDAPAQASPIVLQSRVVWVEGRAACPSCGHAMERAACHDRCDSCGALVDCEDGG